MPRREPREDAVLDDVPVRSCGGTAAKARAVSGEAVCVVSVGCGPRRDAGAAMRDAFGRVMLVEEKVRRSVGESRRSQVARSLRGAASRDRGFSPLSKHATSGVASVSDVWPSQSSELRISARAQAAVWVSGE